MSLNNGVSIVQKHRSNTSTMLFPPVAKTLLKCLRIFEQWTHRCLADISGHLTHYQFKVILTITNATSKNLPSSDTKCLPIMTDIHPPELRFLNRR